MNGPQGELGEAHSKLGAGQRRVLHMLGPSSGGIRRHVRYLASHPPDGYSTSGVAGPGDLADFFEGLPFFALGGGTSPVDGARPDLIHAHGLTAAARALRLTALGLSGPPVVASVHTSMRQTLRAGAPGAGSRLTQRAMWAAARLALRRAAALIVVSTIVHEEMGFGEIVPPALDMPVAAPGARARVREELGTPPDRLVILAVGRLHPDKQLDIFIDSVAGTGAEGWVAGDGPQRERLSSLAEGTGVRLLGHRSDVGDLLAAADVFALPAAAESYGFAVMEAVGAGLPVIATRTGSIPELVGDAGILVAPDDAAGFREAVHRVATSPGLRSDLAEAARNRRLPSPAELAARVGAVYDRVLAGRPRH